MTGRARELHEAFDREFARAPRAPDAPGHELLRIALDGEPYALVLCDDLESIHVDLRIVPVPATAPEVLGVGAVRGAIVVIRDLRALLGLETTRAPRWTRDRARYGVRVRRLSRSRFGVLELPPPGLRARRARTLDKE